MATIKVTKGQTLSGIAKAAGTTVSAIQKANPNITNVNKINIGQNITLPSSSKTSVSTGKSTNGTSKGSPLPGLGGAGYTSSKSSVPIKTGTTQGTSYSNIPSGQTLSTYKGSGFNTSGSRKASSPFSTIGSFFKDAINTISKPGKNKDLSTKVLSADNIFTKDTGYQIIPNEYTPGYTPLEPDTPFKIISDAATNTINRFSGEPTTEPAITQEPSSSTMDVLGSGEQPLNPDLTGTSDLYSDTATPKSGGTTTSTLEKTLADGSTLTEETTGPAMQSQNFASSNAGLGAKFDALNSSMGIKDSKMNADMAFMSDGSKSEFTQGKLINIANNAAKLFNTPEQANQWLNSPEGQQKLKESGYLDNGGKISDIVNKVQAVKNGLVGEQTTAEYLQGGPKDLQEQKKLQNQAIADTLGWDKKMKEIYFGNDEVKGIVEQQRLDSEAQVNYYEQQLARTEKNEKEKARLQSDKLQAEYNQKDAETEMARINAKSNLTEFLAKIGALRTDGNALTGLEKLEQAYQAQRQSLRQNFLFAKREIDSAMEDRIFSAESQLEERKFKLSQDLSKTEREVMMDSMKLDYDTKSDIRKIQMDWANDLKQEKDKNEAKANSYNNAYNDQLLKLMMGGVPENIARAMITGKGEVIPTQTNVNTIKSFGAKAPETEPKFTGENLILSLKSAKDIINKTGLGDNDLLQLQRELNEGWSLEQIAKNQGMPTEIFNVLRPYVQAPK